MKKYNIPDLGTKCSAYTEEFNISDEECYANDIPNSGADAYLMSNIPLFECPDKTIEKTYYFRWWTLRKHWKNTPDGHILTEFMANIGWGGTVYNSSCCPFGHHVREARWLRDREGWVREFIMFWLERRGPALTYSTWFASSVEDYLRIHPDPDLEKECLDLLVSLWEDRLELSGHSSGLFWSHDGWDGRELSISGSGLRPTMNSYMCGDAASISRMASRLGRDDVARLFAERAEDLKQKMDKLLWDGDFYKVIPCEKETEIPDARPSVSPEHDVREELGFIPWYFGIPGDDRSAAFRYLTDEEGFSAPYGITTAERKHPRFMYSHPHECLWNGPVWPYATSKTLTAAANHLRAHGEAWITKKDYYRLLKQYAASHRIKDADGADRMWIDEDMDPFTGDWTARTLLKEANWDPGRGGYERGKDYNHSTFCDLVLSGLLGIDRNNGAYTADPLIPDEWDWFCVTGLPGGYAVIYDRAGGRYGNGPGLHIVKDEKTL